MLPAPEQDMEASASGKDVLDEPFSEWQMEHHYLVTDNTSQEHPVKSLLPSADLSHQGAAPHDQDDAVSGSQIAQFDPRALLNPKSHTSKRPASSGADSDRGRSDAMVAGQLSLVERLHNVQERTVSPAKRPKTEDPNNKNNNHHTNFGSSGTLDLQKNSRHLPAVQSGPPIDLTISERLLIVWC